MTFYPSPKPTFCPQYAYITFAKCTEKMIKIGGGLFPNVITARFAKSA